MARADRDVITSRMIPLSTLFTDPVLRAAFRRAEDADSMFAVPPAKPRTLDGGAAEVVREFELA
jgi:hypothetical protein